MRQNPNYIRRTLNEIKSLSNRLKEAYVYEDDMDMYDVEEDDLEMPMGQKEDRVNQIRQIALNGIQEYAQDVDSEEYDFFKRIWMMCDKVSSTKNRDKEEE